VNIGWAGLGKLGLPCALALAKYGGHHVTGYDVSGLPWRVLCREVKAPQEDGIDELLDPDLLARAGNAEDLVACSDVIFAAVQTPHAAEYGGEQPVTGEPRDFEYAYLVQAVRDICAAARQQRKLITLAVVSTVLPGTVSRLIRPLLGRHVMLAYVPQFIAMGTTIEDFINPEFVVCGADERAAAAAVQDVFAPLHGGSRLFVTSIENAEAIKVLYNTFISVKVVWANTVMELCHKTGADCDQVADALAKGTDRIISPAYMRGGMGDGGSCHPRDLIAMSWLARRLDLSYDLFGETALAREVQAAWLADLVQHYHELAQLPVVLFGRAYKPGSDLIYGSPALLLAWLLEERGVRVTQHIDPYVHGGGIGQAALFAPSVFVIATAHPEFFDRAYPAGSVVIDPFGRAKDGPGVTVVRVGRKG
jgi:UDPglucose 6-dehydrogenase